MFGANSPNSPTTIIDCEPWMFISGGGVIYRRSAYTRGNEPIVIRQTRRERAWDREYAALDRMIEGFKVAAKAEATRRLQVSRELNRRHIREARLFSPPPLVEAMFHKPTFVRRACGGRWRVMTP